MTFETLFGLIAATGLRMSEALALRDGDVDLTAGTLTVGRSKFGKSRRFPLHPSTVEALRRYRRVRGRKGRAARRPRSSSARAASDWAWPRASVT